MKVFASGPGFDYRVRCMDRSRPITRAVARLVRRNAYFVEQASFGLAVYRRLVKKRFHVVYFADLGVGNVLHDLRRRFGGEFRLLYMNGSPTPPGFLRGELVQQVTRPSYEEAIAFGASPYRQYLLPHGLFLKQSMVPRYEQQAKLRGKLGLPMNRKIVLSVGHISRTHKRMDYLICELAQIAEPRPMLVMLGQTTPETPTVRKLAQQILGPEGEAFLLRTVPPEAVSDYYQAADVFALASLREGFGLVYVEAASFGLPTLAHRSPVMEYVVGRDEELGSFDRPGELCCLLSRYLKEPLGHANRHRRRQSVLERFDWDSLRASYVDMFHAASEKQLCT